MSARHFFSLARTRISLPPPIFLLSASAFPTQVAFKPEKRKRAEQSAAPLPFHPRRRLDRSLAFAAFRASIFLHSPLLPSFKDKIDSQLPRNISLRLSVR